MGVDVEERGTTCKSDDLSNMRVATSSRTMFSVRRLRRRRGGGAGRLLLVDDEYYDDDEYLERGGCGGGDRHSDDAEAIGATPLGDDVQVYLEKIADEHGVEWKPRVPMRAYEMYEPTRAPTGDTCEPLLKQIETRWKFYKYMLNLDNPRDCIIWSYANIICVRLIFYYYVHFAASS